MGLLQPCRIEREFIREEIHCIFIHKPLFLDLVLIHIRGIIVRSVDTNTRREANAAGLCIVKYLLIFNPRFCFHHTHRFLGERCFFLYIIWMISYGRIILLSFFQIVCTCKFIADFFSIFLYIPRCS